MPKKKTIRHQMKRKLELLTHLHTSRHEEKAANQGRSAAIHSTGTLQTYLQQADNFADYLIDHNMKYCTLEEAQAQAADYVRSRQSTWSQSTARAALAKIFGVPGELLCPLEKRSPDQISRGREYTDRTAAIERNHKDLATACRAMGLRRGKELQSLTAKDIRYKGGDMYARVKGKGGRIREAFILPAGREIISQRIAERPTGPLFTVPSHANVHRWRADYAAQCYQYALDHGHSSGTYYCPHDGSGTRWDKGALDWVSQQMGHGSDRYYTLYYDYLTYGGK